MRAFSKPFAVAVFLLVAPSVVRAGSVEMLRSALRDSDPLVRRDALQEIASLGSDGRPLRSDVLPSITDRDVYIRYYAVHALDAIADCTDATLQALNAAMKDASRDVRKKAIEVASNCAYFAESSVVPVTAALDDSDDDVRRAAIEGLGRLGPLAAKSIPRLVAIASKEPAHREAVVTALGSMFDWPADSGDAITDEIRAARPAADAEYASAVRALLASLKDKQIAVRRAALVSLAKAPMPLVVEHSDPEMLLALANDLDEDVRKDAVNILAQYAATVSENAPDIAAAALETIATLLSDDVEEVRNAAAGSIDATAIDASVVVDHLNDPSARVRALIVSALSTSGDDPLIAEAVAAHASDSSPDVRDAVASALSDIGESAPDIALRALAALSKDPFVTVRMTSAESIATIVNQNARARYAARAEPWIDESQMAGVEVLLALLRDPTKDVRQRAIAGIEQIAPLIVPPPLDALRAALSDDSAAVRVAATRALQSYGPDAAAAASDIAALLSHPVYDVKTTAAATIRYLGPSAVATVPAIRAALASELSSTAKLDLADALGRFGKVSESALPDLIGLVHSVSGTDHDTLVDAFVRIGPASAAALEKAAAATPEEESKSFLGMILPTRKETLTTIATEVQNQLTPYRFPAVDQSGSPVTLEVTPDKPIVAVATWCHYSRDFRRLVGMPLLEKYVHDGIRYVLGDEWPSVARMLDEMVASGEITAAQRDQKLAELKEAAKGSLAAFPSYVDASSYWIASGAPEPESFPTMFDPQKGKFEADEMQWLRSSAVPPKVISLASDAAEAMENE